jgi:hypothetical protein
LQLVDGQLEARGHCGSRSRRGSRSRGCGGRGGLRHLGRLSGRHAGPGRQAFGRLAASFRAAAFHATFRAAFRAALIGPALAPEAVAASAAATSAFALTFALATLARAGLGSLCSLGLARAWLGGRHLGTLARCRACRQGLAARLLGRRASGARLAQACLAGLGSTFRALAIGATAPAAPPPAAALAVGFALSPCRRAFGQPRARHRQDVSGYGFTCGQGRGARRNRCDWRDRWPTLGGALTCTFTAGAASFAALAALAALAAFAGRPGLTAFACLTAFTGLAAGFAALTTLAGLTTFAAFAAFAATFT